MADKGPDAMKDVWWILKIMGVLFVLWVLTGGPARLSQNKLFLKPPAPLDTGETYGGTTTTNKNPTLSGGFTPPAGYRATNAKYFTVYIPAGWILDDSKSKDSYYTGSITNGKTLLTFEYGSSPNMLNVSTDTHNIGYEYVGGINTKFVWPKKYIDGITGAYYHRFMGKDLTIMGNNLSSSEQNTAFTIMRSVRFK